jgi:type II secretory pathway component PulF
MGGMSSGLAGKFFGQLTFLLRQKLPMSDALEAMAAGFDAAGWPDAVRRVRDRIVRGELLWTSLAELPPPFPKEVIPVVEQSESEGALDEELEILSAWPDDGECRSGPVAARVFAEAALHLRRGRPLAEAIQRASRPGDSDESKAAFRALAQASAMTGSLAEAAGRHPHLFGPAIPRLLRQMEWNGNAERTFRDIALALSRGWFQPRVGDPC